MFQKPKRLQVLFFFDSEALIELGGDQWLFTRLNDLSDN